MKVSEGTILSCICMSADLQWLHAGRTSSHRMLILTLVVIILSKLITEHGQGKKVSFCCRTTTGGPGNSSERWIMIIFIGEY